MNEHERAILERQRAEYVAQIAAIDAILGDTWLCPLCSAEYLPYGQPCERYPDCGNPLTITGRMYAVRSVPVGDAAGIGISEIAE